MWLLTNFMVTLHKFKRNHWIIGEWVGDSIIHRGTVHGGRRTAMREHHRARAEGDPEYREMLRAEKERRAAV